MTTPRPFRCYVIGAESLLVRCCEILLADGHSVLGVVTRAPEIARWAEQRGLRVVAPGRDLASRLGAEPFEWLFSIANLSILPDELLALPRRGTINFHDGPLPRYAGLHAPAWAILHGERSHGVSWHLVEGGVDEGDLLEQELFELDLRETALTLNTRCYELGAESFARLVSALARGEYARRPQDLAQRTYFGRYERPAAACALDFAQPVERLDALVRALDFGRYPNPLGVPKVVLDGGALLVPEVLPRRGSTAEPPGTVVAADERGLEVAASGGSLRFPRVLDADGAALSAEALRALGVVPGARLELSRERAEALGRADRALAPEERFWAARLEQLAPVRVAGPRGEEPPSFERQAIESGADPAALLATLAAWVLRTSGQASFDVGHRHPGIADRVRGAAQLFATHVPLRLEVDREAAFASLREAAAAELGRVETRGTYPRELVHRRPGLRRPEWDLVFERVTSLDGYAPPDGVAVALVTDGSTAALFLDARRVPRGARMRGELEVLAAAALADEGARVGALPLLSDEERQRVLVEWNRTEAPYPRDACVHRLFEAQADRTPDAVALVCRGEQVTYRELDRRANQLARHLAELGVGRDTPVGLAVDRSVDLVASALGILKAGGAYVPLDPSHPAERIAFALTDTRAPVVVTRREHRAKLSAAGCRVVDLDEEAELIAARPDERVAAAVGGEHLAYVIYTSGSTGTPKGVMVEHRNVASFFAGMDRRIEHDPPGTWLAVTSLGFDISVLELFWTLARGFRVVIASTEDRVMAGGGTGSASRSSRPIDFSLFYFAADEGERAGDKYRLLFEGARFADQRGFCAVWTPERHFHAFGGLYPNPSVASAALAMVTERVQLRAGSCVSPLHHPARIAEEWALVDNLSKGRVGISFAAGWQPNDFVLRPEGFENNKQRMLADIELVRRLWRGETVELEGPKGPVAVRTLPRPVQPELPFFLTAAGNPETFELAGRLGGGILTHLLGQSLDEVRQKIEVFRRARREAGHEGEGHVVLMLHTFVGPDAATVKETVREPMKAYLKSSLMLIQQHAWSFPAFKRHAREDRSFTDNFASLSLEDTEALLDHSFERYYETSGLFGTPERCLETVEACRAMGVDEIGCLIDFGVDTDVVLAHLPWLDRVRAAAAEASGETDHSIAAELARHRVTHMQCTPSMARMLVANEEARAALRGLTHLMIGGEALPGSLARELSLATGARITNMYGPTETTIWSSTHEVEACEGVVPIGRPIANTRLYVLDEDGQPVPVGAPGELYIGGEGVARGYWDRPELTGARFLPDPFVGGGARMYRTGDQARWREDGCVEFLGRLDHQVKIRGHRVELGEIEARLGAMEGVRDAVVIAHEPAPGDVRLAAYVVADTLDPRAVKAALRERLPEIMIPAHIVRLDRLPLTPNRKIDRKALPSPTEPSRPTSAGGAPAGEVQRTIAEIWRRILGLSEVGARDNFFELGGHSLLAVQAQREIAEATGKRLTVTDVFRFPTIAALAAHLERGTTSAALRDAADRKQVRPPSAADAPRRVLRRR